MSGSAERLSARAWAEISQSALVNNIRVLRARLGPGNPTRLLAVVKADAYGHGLDLAAPLCYREGIRDFGVATVDEGIALRVLLPGDAVIYLMAASLPADAFAIAAHRLVPFVGDLDLARALSEEAVRQNQCVGIHLDVDTGIGRAGVPPAEAADLLAAIEALPHLQVTGVATHFADADDDPQDAREQNALFQQMLCTLDARGKNLLVHASNSPAMLALGEVARYDLVRPGLLLYGIEPTPGLFASDGADHPEQETLQPVLSLRARVLLCRKLPEGATISYGRTFAVPPGGGIYATIGIGYGDGFPRRLGGGVGSVLIAGQYAPICGRICMDQLVVDVSHIAGVSPGMVCTLLGRDGEREITAGQIAAAIETTPHEISTCLTRRVPRILTA